jgi:hypothetical protein
MSRSFSSEIHPGLLSIKNKLLTEFSIIGKEGLNITRVENFITNQGLEFKPYIFFHEDDLPKVKQIIGNTNLLRQSFSNAEKGTYIPEIDLILVIRHKDFEKINGKTYVEGLLVHEQAHANSMHNRQLVDGDSLFTPRVGFALPQNKRSWGWFLEEGWADVHRAKYISQFASPEELRPLATSLKYGNIEMDETIPLTTPEGILPIPFKYLFLKNQNTPTTIPSAMAGFAFELIIREYPDIQPLLLDGRKSVEGLRNLAVYLENIKPGLYKLIQNGDSSETSFNNKLLLVINTIYGSIEKAVLASGSLKAMWNRMLSKEATSVQEK